MNVSTAVKGFIRPRWAAWLGELTALGLTAAELRYGNKDWHGALPEWLRGDARTVAAETAFEVGRHIAADAKLKHHGDGIVALYAAGYLSVAAACLQATIDDALERYPHRPKVARKGGPDWAAAPVRELQQALIVAVHLPYALAHIDGINDISLQARAEGLAAVLHWHGDALVNKTLDATWAACVPKGGALEAPPHDVTLADQQALVYSNFLNSISLRAQRDPIIQLHFSTLRERVNDYQRAVFHVPPHQPKT